jgi:hypothetical protein
MIRDAHDRELRTRARRGFAQGADEPPPWSSTRPFCSPGGRPAARAGSTDRGGTLAIAGIHLSDIPTLNYQRHHQDASPVGRAPHWADARSSGLRGQSSHHGHHAVLSVVAPTMRWKTLPPGVSRGGGADVDNRVASTRNAAAPRPDRYSGPPPSDREAGAGPATGADREHWIRRVDGLDDLGGVPHRGRCHLHPHMKGPPASPHLARRVSARARSLRSRAEMLAPCTPGTSWCGLSPSSIAGQSVLRTSGRATGSATRRPRSQWWIRTARCRCHGPCRDVPILSS